MRHPYIRRSVDIDMCAVDDCPAPEDKDDPEVHYTQEDIELADHYYKEYTALNKNDYLPSKRHGQFTATPAHERKHDEECPCMDEDRVIGPDNADFIRDEERNK